MKHLNVFSFKCLGDEFEGSFKSINETILQFLAWASFLLKKRVKNFFEQKCLRKMIQSINSKKLDVKIIHHP